METKEENLHSSKKDACCNYFMRSFGFVLALFLLWLAISYNMESDMLTELESSPIEGGFGDVYEPPNVHLKTVFEVSKEGKSKKHHHHSASRPTNKKESSTKSVTISSPKSKPSISKDAAFIKPTYYPTIRPTQKFIFPYFGHLRGEKIHTNMSHELTVKTRLMEWLGNDTLLQTLTNHSIIIFGEAVSPYSKAPNISMLNGSYVITSRKYFATTLSSLIPSRSRSKVFREDSKALGTFTMKNQIPSIMRHHTNCSVVVVYAGGTDIKMGKKDIKLIMANVIELHRIFHNWHSSKGRQSYMYTIAFTIPRRPLLGTFHYENSTEYMNALTTELKHIEDEKAVSVASGIDISIGMDEASIVSQNQTNLSSETPLVLQISSANEQNDEKELELLKSALPPPPPAPPINITWVNEQIDIFNNGLRHYAFMCPGLVALVDIDGIFSQHNSSNSIYWSDDYVSLSELGQELVGQMVFQTLNEFKALRFHKDSRDVC